MKKGDKIQARMAGHRWVNGEIVLASPNGRSLALGLEQTLVTGGPFGILGDMVALLLFREGENWVDLISGAVIELRGTNE